MKIKHALLLLAALTLVAVGAASPLLAAKELRWGTSAVGSSGHKALTNLTEMLKKEMTDYNFTVQPTPGAIISVKGYATGQFEGYYGADVAFYELANNISRFKGFKEKMKRAPVQSFWAFTVESGLAIHSRDRDKIKKWSDLDGKRTFTGPRPWDTRAQIERALAALKINHEYMEVSKDTAGSLLEGGRFVGMGVYTNAEAATAPWLIQAAMQTNWTVLNPSAEEEAKLVEAGFTVVEVPTKVFGKADPYSEKIKVLPFYYGLHVGMEIPADDVYRMLIAIEKHAGELAKADKAFKQIAADMPGMQVKGVKSSVNLVEIHPGLARYMKEKGVWDAKWDSRVAKPM
jgi:hypothetical protein